MVVVEVVVDAGNEVAAEKKIQVGSDDYFQSSIWNLIWLKDSINDVQGCLVEQKDDVAVAAVVVVVVLELVDKIGTRENIERKTVVVVVVDNTVVVFVAPDDVVVAAAFVVLVVVAAN